MSKIWANGFVITVAVGLSLTWSSAAARDSSRRIGSALYGRGCDLSVLCDGDRHFPGTVARTMPQLGLLYILVAVPMNILSGSNTPLESMPRSLKWSCRPRLRRISFPSPRRFSTVGPGSRWSGRILAVALVASLFLGLAVLRFRRVAGQAT